MDDESEQNRLLSKPQNIDDDDDGGLQSLTRTASVEISETHQADAIA